MTTSLSSMKKIATVQAMLLILLILFAYLTVLHKRIDHETALREYFSKRARDLYFKGSIDSIY